MQFFVILRLISHLPPGPSRGPKTYATIRNSWSLHNGHNSLIVGAALRATLNARGGFRKPLHDPRLRVLCHAVAADVAVDNQSQPDLVLRRRLLDLDGIAREQRSQPYCSDFSPNKVSSPVLPTRVLVQSEFQAGVAACFQLRDLLLQSIVLPDIHRGSSKFRPFFTLQFAKSFKDLRIKHLLMSTEKCQCRVHVRVSEMHSTSKGGRFFVSDQRQFTTRIDNCSNTG